MTGAAPPRTIARAVMCVFAAVASILIGITMTAQATVGAETRVGAHSSSVDVFVGASDHIAAGQRLGNNPERVIHAVATGVAANTPARFAVNSAGEATMSLRAGSASLEVTEHAALRMTQRGISIDAAEATLARTPFPYFHNGVWKSRFYDPTSKIFLGTVGGRVTTAINNAKPGYIENLKAAVP